MKTLAEYAHTVLSLLEERGYGAALAGGLAHNIWSGSGGQFDTEDVDVAVLVPEGSDLDADAFANALGRKLGEDCFYATPFDFGDRVIQRILCGKKLVQVDFVFADRGYAEAAIANSRLAMIGAAEHAILSPEDVILYKSLGKRRKDVLRIEKLVEAQTLDREYLEAWARHLDRWWYVERAIQGDLMAELDLD